MTLKRKLDTVDLSDDEDWFANKRHSGGIALCEKPSATPAKEPQLSPSLDKEHPSMETSTPSPQQALSQVHDGGESEDEEVPRFLTAKGRANWLNPPVNTFSYDAPEAPTPEWTLSPTMRAQLLEEMCLRCGQATAGPHIKTGCICYAWRPIAEEHISDVFPRNTLLIDLRLVPHWQGRFVDLPESSPDSVAIPKDDEAT